jgi:uncharacterized protein YjbJ (UPF0337 family)
MREPRPRDRVEITTIASQEERDMNWDQVQGNWKQVQGKLREAWGNLTDDDVFRIEGNQQQLVGRIQERYGIAKEDAEAQVDEWLRRM